MPRHEPGRRSAPCPASGKDLAAAYRGVADPPWAFEQDAADFAGFARVKLQQPMLVLTGEKASGTFLIEQAKLVDSQVEGVVIPGAGHWLMEEAPGQTMPRLVEFLNRR